MESRRVASPSEPLFSSTQSSGREVDREARKLSLKLTRTSFRLQSFRASRGAPSQHSVRFRFPPSRRRSTRPDSLLRILGPSRRAADFCRRAAHRLSPQRTCAGFVHAPRFCRASLRLAATASQGAPSA